MSFKLTIIIPDTKIADTLKRFNGHAVTVEHVPEGRAKRKALIAEDRTERPKVPHSRAEYLLTMTGKQAKKGTLIYPAMVAFEKLEANKGIGNVTVKMFRAELKRRRWKVDLAQRCVTEKFLSYLS